MIRTRVGNVKLWRGGEAVIGEALAKPIIGEAGLLFWEYLNVCPRRGEVICYLMCAWF